MELHRSAGRLGLQFTQAAWVIVAAGAFPLLAMADDSVNLASQVKAGTVNKVDIKYEVGGDLELVVEGKGTKLPTSVVATLAYEERWIDHATGLKGPRRSLRHYSKASAVLKVDDGGLKPELRSDRRIIAAEFDGGLPVLIPTTGPITREELELVTVPVNSVVIDLLLPAKTVKTGDTWTYESDTVATLLGLDAVAEQTLKSELKDVVGTQARIEMAGNVKGATEGVSVELAVKARYTFDTKLGQIDWLSIAYSEKRAAGHVSPGVDVTARLQMHIKRSAASKELSEKLVQGWSEKREDANRDLAYELSGGRCSFQHDRRWHVVSDSGDVAVLRFMDRGELVAQCNVSPLPEVEHGKEVSLENFKSDIQRLLGQSFEKLVDAEERQLPNGKGTLYKVVVEGQASKLPIRWIYYRKVDADGRPVVVVFTHELALTDRFAHSDKRLIGSLEIQAGKAAKDKDKKPTPAE